MMKLIVFAVEQGLCAYIRTPNDYGILVDCGKSGCGEAASPAMWLAEHEAPSLKWREGDAAVSLVVTHPHENHVADIDAVVRELSPVPLCRGNDFDWPTITEPPSNANESVRAYHSWLTARGNQESAPDFGADVRCFSLSREEAERLGGDSINNRSVVTVVSYKSDEGYAWKVVIAGDNRADGWEALLAEPEFREAIGDADFFVTSSHGQESGFSADLFKAMGKPLANISCSRKGVECADAKYRKNAQGVKFPDGKRTHLITPDDGNITVEMRDDGNFDMWLFKP